ncbi:uncharacterized protein LOC143051057 [Mytilus galloprovincialis]|uniref:uncharacterized protein LOC143051057 n=1 Tax=Mytilus galloprovincialis TaxID=29158 RepID=UPI003F7CBD9A
MTSLRTTYPHTTVRSHLVLFYGEGLILLVIASTVLGSYQNDKKKSRPITYRQYCRDGDSIDKLFPDPFPFTCKPGPGKNVVCQTLFYNLKNSFKCPGYGYISGWEYLEGFGQNVRCCEDKNIEYTYRDCDVQVDDATSNGRSYRVNKGKVIVGFNSEDGGVTWNNIECSYTKCPTNTWRKQVDSTYYKGN